MMKKEPKLEYQRAAQAEKDFINQIYISFRDKKLVPDNQVANKLTSLIGCSPNTAYSRMKKPDTFQAGELRKLVQAVSPDIGAVLRFLGYREQDIRKFAKEAMQ